jgi:hypothetical protein
VERHYNADVNEAQEHDSSGCELPAGSVFCKECKLVSLALRGALLIRKSAGLVGRLCPSKGTLTCFLLL